MCLHASSGLDEADDNLQIITKIPTQQMEANSCGRLGTIPNLNDCTTTPQTVQCYRKHIDYVHVIDTITMILQPSYLLHT